jgi:hypothetical protein
VSFLERAKQAAEQARQAAVETTGKASASLRDPATAEKAKRGLHLAKRGLATAVERIDPGVLADVVIKATSLQERANTALRAKHSPYRISQIEIGASIPPSVTFAISRLSDPEHEAIMAADSTALLEAEAAGTASITTLDGGELQEDDLEAIAGE